MGDVQAGEVKKLERPHAKPRAIAQDAVDLLDIGNVLAKDTQRFSAIGTTGMVDQKARRVWGLSRKVTSRLGQRTQALHHLHLGTFTAHHLDDLHQRYGVEEVKTGNPLGVLASAGDLRDGQRRRVGSQYRARRNDGFQLAKQPLLGLQVLDDGFDQQIATGQGFQAGGGLHARQGLFQLLGAELALGHLARQQVLVKAQRLFDRFRAHVIQQHLAA